MVLLQHCSISRWPTTQLTTEVPALICRALYTLVQTTAWALKVILSFLSLLRDLDTFEDNRCFLKNYKQFILTHLDPECHLPCEQLQLKNGMTHTTKEYIILTLKFKFSAQTFSFKNTRQASFALEEKYSCYQYIFVILYPQSIQKHKIIYFAVNFVSKKQNLTI